MIPDGECFGLCPKIAAVPLRLSVSVKKQEVMQPQVPEAYGSSKKVAVTNVLAISCNPAVLDLIKAFPVSRMIY